ncbi:HisA/HisF-related TIM barrel protein, partial [Aliarcobacter butzleri]|uniref:HisA/HisF-related TIM barrel protein n=1 Tax=Aliarcobacter butzleri TaxID=28197 RepID=UPI003AF7DDE1
GEIVVNSVDNDGVMQGYDIEFLKEIKKNIRIPIIALVGAGNLNHIKEVFESSNVVAVACGSMFVYQGPLIGVLISYPPYQKIQELLGNK